jgi:uncharacterized protein involved in outer membrane biogenesis
MKGMRRIRTILLFLVAAIVLFVAILTTIIINLNDDHYRWIVTRAAKYFAGLEVTVDGPFSVELSSEPSITASKIRISDLSGPTTAELGRLEVKVALLPLTSGALLIKHLLIHDATVSIVRRTEVLKPEPEKPSDIIFPVFESVSLCNVQLTISDNDKSKDVRLVLRKFSLNDIGDEGQLHLKGDGALNGNKFEIDGQFGSLANMLNGDEPYPVNFRLNVAGFSLAISGTIDNLIHGRGLNVRVLAEADEMTKLLNIANADFPNLDQLNLDATIVGDASSPGLADIQLNVSSASNFNMEVKGSMENMLTGKGTSLQVSGSCADKNILEMLLPGGMPEIHSLKGEGRIYDGDGVYIIEAKDLNGSNEQGATMNLEGTICFTRAVDKMPAFKELDLHCQFLSPTTASAKFPAVDFLPELGALSVKGRVRFSGNLLRFENLTLHSSHPQGLQIKTVGIMQIPLGTAKNRPVQINCQAIVTAPDMGAAKPITGKQYLSGSGPLMAKARIIGTSKALSIEDLYITIGESGPVRAKWHGRIERVPLSKGELPSGVDITGSIGADEASELPSLAGISLPDLGPLKTTLRIIEQKGVYCFKDIQLSVGSQEGLWLKGAGSINMAVKDGSVSFGGLDAEVIASAPNLAAVPIVADLDLPDLNPLHLNAHIIDRDGHMHILDVKNFKLDAGTKKDFLRIQGQIRGLIGGDQRAVEAFFKTTSKPWVMKLLKDSDPENHMLEGKVKLVATPTDMRIEELEIRTTGTRPLYLEAEGTIKETGKTYELEGRISSGVNDMSSLQSFIGIKLPPLAAPSLEGQIKGNMRKGSFKGAVRFGRSEFNMTVSHSRTKQRPSVVAKIVASTVRLADIGFYPDIAEDLPSPSKSGPKPDRRLFSNTPFALHALKTIDLSASIDIDKLKGKNFVLNKLDFDISLKDGKLQVAPAKVTYKNGFASIDFTLDAVASKPRMGLKVTAEDIDIEALLSHIHKSSYLKGRLNLVVDLQSAGNSFREIAAAIEGEIGMAIEKGKINRTVAFMGSDAVDLLNAILPRGKYKDLNCMALRFIFTEGIGKSETIYIDIPDMFVGGAAHIDLHKETIKMVLQPKPKKTLPGMTSAVVIDGPIANPKIRKLPFREAAKLYGEIFVPVVFLPARALGYLWYIIKKDAGEECPCLVRGMGTE